jgi:hypothetical protein
MGEEAASVGAVDRADELGHIGRRWMWEYDSRGNEERTVGEESSVDRLKKG